MLESLPSYVSEQDHHESIVSDSSKIMEAFETAQVDKDEYGIVKMQCIYSEVEEKAEDDSQIEDFLNGKKRKLFLSILR